MKILRLGQSLCSSNVPKESFSNKYSLDFDGVDDYVTCGDANVFTPNYSGSGRGFTICCWVKLANTGGKVIISKSAFWDVGTKYEYELRTFFTTMPMMVFYGNGGNLIFQRLIIDTVLAVDTWYHLAYTFDLGSTSSSIIGYLNGVQATASSGGTYSNQGTWSPVINTTAHLQFARQGTGSQYNECKLDEVGIFDDLLSASDITSIYNSGTPNSLLGQSYSTNIVGYWRNGDPTGTGSYPTIIDEAKNNDGTMTNMVSGDIVTDVP